MVDVDGRQLYSRMTRAENEGGNRMKREPSLEIRADGKQDTAENPVLLDELFALTLLGTGASGRTLENLGGESLTCQLAPHFTNHLIDGKGQPGNRLDGDEADEPVWSPGAPHCARRKTNAATRANLDMTFLREQMQGSP